MSRQRPPDPQHPDAVLTGAAAASAGAPDVRTRLLAEHTAGPDGRCLGCRSAVRLAPRWPCRLAILAAMVPPERR